MLEFYGALMQQGYKLSEIDEMDVLYYLEVLKSTAKKAGKSKIQYLDDMF